MVLSTVVRSLRISMEPYRLVVLHATNLSTLLLSDATRLASMRINLSQNVTSSNNLLAYRPQYRDTHNSSLAAIFINLEGVFPCLVPLTDYHPICSVYSEDQDGFRGGKAIIGAGDSGNTFHIFSNSANIKTYSIAVQDCPELTPACFPIYHQISVICFLPRATCS